MNFIQISIEGENLETTTAISLETPVESSTIHDQSISNVLFDRLIRVEIKWRPTSGARLCLSGLEVRKIGLLQPIQVLEEREDSTYEFGGVTGMKDDIKELPPRLEYEGNGTYYTIITVKLEKMRMSSFKGRNVENSINKLNRYFDNIFENVHYFDGAQAAVFRPGSTRSDGSMLADVVLTFTEWTDDFRVDLTRPSILGKH